MLCLRLAGTYQLRGEELFSFAPEEGNAVFVFEQQSQFESLLSSWEAKMTAPSFGRTRSGTSGRPAQTDLFE